MRIEPLPGPNGLFSVSVMPRFLVDSQQVGWQGAYFTDIDGAPEGTVDHKHARYCVQRGLHQETRRTLGSRDWQPFSTGFSVWRAGDEQRFDWRSGGRSQFLFIESDMAASVLGDARELTPSGHRSPVASHMLELMFDALQADLAQGSPAGPLVGDSLITAIVAHLGGAKASVLRQPARRACARAIELMETRFAEPITLQDLAEVSGLGQRQLCRAVGEATGVSPHQYLLRCRVDNAKRLIARGLSLSEVALDCGFADQSQLTRTFVRQVGTTPGDYRRNLAR
ncbi:AraC family transcriptional regulator [Hydrogenophaga palleronii]|uniref:AraC family transcriptional regulator n=1 Tax=Hydrogenophaga palleronii TaxID=65655 RepID=A0ABU1WK22_9BURK|nr:AraC family transcriptional regulator [Hydrogenophaga palleronii]MDR7149409.1 AraC family transcriptional regulator [Hydrogenophaga palleronii]